MIRNLGRFSKLPAGERRAFLRAWVYLLAADLALRVVSFPRVRSAAAKCKLPAESGRNVEGRLKQARVAVKRASRHHLINAMCLQQSLALQRLLADESIETELRIGVQRTGETIEAHAWVEHEGRPVGGAGDIGARFLPLVGVVE